MRIPSMALGVALFSLGCIAPEQRSSPETSAPAKSSLQPVSPKPAELAASNPKPAELPANYTLTDTAEWGNMLEQGKRAVLRRDGVAIDTVDLAFRVTRVGMDSLVFLPIRTDPHPIKMDSTVWYEDAPATYVLWTPVGRRELTHILSLFDDFFSSPAMVGESVVYWGFKRGARIYAMRYDFRTARLDSLFLRQQSFGPTDYRYVFGTPQVSGAGISFAGAIVDSTSWQVIREDTASAPLPDSLQDSSAAQIRR